MIVIPKFSKPYFVMLNHPNCGYIPMETGDGHDFELAKFETKQQADAAGKENPLGEAYGYEVFCIGNGE